MANTPQENQLIRLALLELSRVYSNYLTTNKFFQDLLGCASDMLFNYVKFQDDAPFRTNLQLTGKIPEGCTVSGSTDRQGTRFALLHSVVYINRAVATGGTVLHELLHALSHNAWYLWASTNKKWLNEGVTEYLTRKVIKKAANSQFEVARDGTYDSEFATFKNVKAQAKLQATMPAGGVRPRKKAVQATQPAQNQESLTKLVCNAYFLGQVSSSNALAQAISVWG
jgi:hypothetical protein